VPYADRWTTVKVEIDAGIAWVELNRPEKRNAMNPTLNAEMVEVLLALDADDPHPRRPRRAVRLAAFRDGDPTVGDHRVHSCDKETYT